MDINTILTAIRNAVHDDADTQSWCTTNYSRNHYVYVGIDERNPPPESRYPLVHIYPRAKSEGYDLSEQRHMVGVTCGLHDASERTTGKAKVVEYTGVQNIETFRKHVETAVNGAGLDDELWVGRLESDYETVEAFPFFIANMEFTLTHEYSQGDGVFA